MSEEMDMSICPINMTKNGVDMLSLSGHKLHAQKGMGVLYVRRGTEFSPFLIGGHQERGRRGGTENTPSIIGLGRACELAAENMALMSQAPMYTGASRRITEINAQMKQIQMSDIPPEIKRQRIDQLYQLKNEIAQSVEERRAQMERVAGKQ